MSDFITRKRYVNTLIGVSTTLLSLFLLVVIPWLFNLFDNNIWTALAINSVVALVGCYFVSNGINIAQRLLKGETEDALDVYWTFPGMPIGIAISALTFLISENKWLLLFEGVVILIIAVLLWIPKK